MAENVHNIEVLSYIVNDHDEQIKSIRAHNHEVNNSLVLVQEHIRLINGNLEKMLVDSKILTNKINVLTDDLRDRTNKSRLIQKIASFWPVLIVGLVIMSAVDFHKLDIIIKSIA